MTTYPHDRSSRMISWNVGSMPPFTMPVTFSMTSLFGLKYRSRRTYSRNNWLRGSSIIRLPAVEKPWHGGDPSSTSSSPGFRLVSLPAMRFVSSAMSPSCTGTSGKFRRNVAHAFASHSTASSSRYPAMLKPRLDPPQPANRLTTVGAFLLRGAR